MSRPVTVQTSHGERGPRVAQLLRDADPLALQELAEAGVRNIAAGSSAAYGLAAAIEATFAPEAPPFVDGDRVKVRGRVGTVVDRYLNEEGDWEYQVKLRLAGRPRTEPYRLSELEAA